MRAAVFLRPGRALGDMTNEARRDRHGPLFFFFGTAGEPAASAGDVDLLAARAPRNYPRGMSSSAPERPFASVADLLAIPEEERFHEILDGVLVPKAKPSLRHGAAQAGLAAEIAGVYGPRARGRGPGGWVFATEVEILFEPRQVYRPDVVGWRRERLPRLPEETPVTLLPDWVCEILSPSNKQNDLFKKLRTYARCQVPHYWIVDPEVEVLAVYRWTEQGYLLVLTAEGQERVRAEPFEQVELTVRGLLAGDEGEEGAPPGGEGAAP